MRPRERQETGEQDLFRSRLDRIIGLTHCTGQALSRDRLAVFGGAVRIGSSRMAPAARRCRRS
jgi:hypothetical protein